MANKIRIKRRAAGGAAGAPASLENAELAYNEQDNVLYYGFGTGGAGGTATQCIPIGGPGAFVTNANLLATRLDQFAAPNTAVNFNNQRIIGLADPSASTDAATKQYVDNLAQGLDTKGSVRAATTANITLSAPQTIDGVSLIAGDRVLVKNQTTPAQNGIYVVAAGAWTRATDMNSWAEVPAAFTFVENGTTLADTSWTCTSDPGGTLDTTAITWTQFAGAGTYTAGDGLQLSGTQFSAKLDGATLSVSAAGLRLNATYPGQNTIVTLGTVTTGTWNATAVAANYGGTGLTSYTIGDLLYASGAAALAKLAAVAVGSVLLSNGVGAAPTWGKVALGSAISGTLPVANGGTGATTITGLVKGNGTAAFTAAVAGTDYLDPNGTIDGGTF